MTAWGVVAVCAIGGGVAGPLLEQVARRAPRLVAAGGSGAAGSGSSGEDFSVGSGDGPAPPGPSGAAGPAGAAGAAGAAGFALPAGPSAQVGAGATGTTVALKPNEHGAGTLPKIVVVSVVSVVTAAAFGLAAVRLGAVPSLAAYCALFGTLVAVSVTDLRTGLVPRRLLYPGLALVAVGLVASSADAGAWKPFLDAAVGGVIAFVVFYVIWWVYPKGLGFGDVRLAGLCGASLGYLGFEQLYLGFLAAFLLGALAGVVVLARKGARRFPFAPALAAGTAFGVLWGGWLGNLWLHPG